MAEASSQSDEKLDLKVSDSHGALTHFKVKKTTKFRKILTAYASKAGIEERAIRLMVDGERVNLEQCPGDLDMENGDQIDAMVEQQGGKRDPGNTQLLTACFDGDVAAARLALDRGADVNRANEDGVTPLFIACQQGHVDVALVRGCACRGTAGFAHVNATAPPQHHYVPE